MRVRTSAVMLVATGGVIATGIGGVAQVPLASLMITGAVFRRGVERASSGRGRWFSGAPAEVSRYGPLALVVVVAAILIAGGDLAGLGARSLLIGAVPASVTRFVVSMAEFTGVFTEKAAFTVASWPRMYSRRVSR